MNGREIISDQSEKLFGFVELKIGTIERFDKTVPLVLLDQWNWDQIVQIFYFIKVQLFLLFSGRIIGITLWLQRFLGFMGVKRFQGTIYSELFLLLLIPLWWHLSREKRNPTYRNEIVIRQEHGVHASTTLAAIGYFFSSSFNINSGMIRIFWNKFMVLRKARVGRSILNESKDLILS